MMEIHGKYLNFMEKKKIKILFGIQTTGSGHVTRSIEIIKKLSKTEEFDIDILLSGENKNIEIPFEVKYRFKGLSFNTQQDINIINLLKNNNIFRFFKDVYSLNLKQYDLVLTDFEPITSWASTLKFKKVIGIGNHYKFLSKTFSSNVYYNLNKIICKILSPIDDYIYFDYFKGEKSCLPIIKEELIDNKTKAKVQKNLVLTYIHSIPWHKQLIEFSEFEDYNFIIYTTDKNIPDNIKIANFLIKKTNPDSFNKDLLKCNTVVCSAGFQLTSESIFLGKKLYVMPIKRQIEQIYNAEQLKNIGITSDKEINKEKMRNLLESDFFVEINFDQNFDLKIIEKIKKVLKK
jgi:uncharacterized protein (TIGR00661 family)